MAAIVQQLQASPIYGGVSAYKYGRAQHKQENATMQQRQDLADQQQMGQMASQVTGQLFDMAGQQYGYDRQVEMKNLAHKQALEMLPAEYKASANAASLREFGLTLEQVGVEAASSQQSIPDFLSATRAKAAQNKYMAANGLEMGFTQGDTARMEELASEEADIRGQMAGGIIAPNDGQTALADISRKRGAIQKTLRPAGRKFSVQTPEGTFQVAPGDAMRTPGGLTITGGRYGAEVKADTQKDVDSSEQMMKDLWSNDPQVQRTATAKLDYLANTLHLVPKGFSPISQTVESKGAEQSAKAQESARQLHEKNAHAAGIAAMNAQKKGETAPSNETLASAYKTGADAYRTSTQPAAPEPPKPTSIRGLQDEIAQQETDARSQGLYSLSDLTSQPAQSQPTSAPAGNDAPIGAKQQLPNGKWAVHKRPGPGGWELE
jgi:hypothetical protein